MAEESAVKVCVRVRPLIKREESESSEPVQLFWRADKQAIHQLDDDGAQTKSFSFDRVFSAGETTTQLYQDIAKPLVVSAVEGYNGTIFAYGQTSSGKTFTMMGSERNAGVIPLAMADVFKTIKNCPKKEFLLRVSYMEIYNETVTDLLCESWKRKPLEIREGNYKNVYVADLTEELVTSPEQALSWITKGEKNRHYGKTKMNQRSSRSHTIFRMILESRERSDPASGENADGAIIVSHLNLVDLAGAERASQTGAEGARFKEGCNINRSLFTLGQVIKKLSDESQKGFLNYRDSKLTRILQNSLGGNAKTVIICTITPATVDETVSTLQFASAAKRMKNDPHVTEVSDEGALLRRYRNEIVDLKRRLQEVSSVTQTTATERESLCQILQEKDQLQREQEDRIKNLTKLLVTASNVALVPKVPKRRVTWGGKLLRSAHLVNEDLASTDMSFAEPYIKKRRADCSLPEEGEDMDEFDSRFDFTALDEPDMEMSSIAVRSSSEGSHFLDSPRASELMLKVSSLERQLEAETQSKQRAEEMSAELQLEISELQKKLEAQAAPSEEEKTVSELEALQSRLQTEVQERQKAEEKSSSLELKVAELEKPSEALLCCEMCEQLRKDLEETIQLCETVVFEKDAIITERDLIKHSLQLVNEDLESLKAEKDSLQKDKDALQKDIDERKDADEFEKLEQESKREYERELESENSKLQQELKQSEDMIQKLQAELATISSELQKKTDLTTELQNFSDKNLVQEVTRLRRSLDDAECLSLETKREWAFLRSENISLKERDANLTTDHEKMEAEVKMIQDKLEQEKSRFKTMQMDLQKELMGAFDENTKLTAVLDGKVPKNLTNNLVLEKTVCDLRKELDQSHERERCLQSKMEELETLSVKADELQRQVCGLSEELRSVGEERDALISAQSSLIEAHQRLKEAQDQLLKMESDLVEAQLKEAELTQQLTETSERLLNLQTDLQHVTQENCTRLASLEEATQKSLQLSAELESVRAERDVLLSEKMREVQSDPDETENLRRTISSITEEREQLQEILQGLRDQRDQLKRDMEENVEMMIETQAELRDAQEKVKELQGKLHRTESQRVQTVDQQKSCEDGQLDKLQDQIKQLTEELSAVVGEKRSDHREQSDVSSLTEERGRLQERLQQLERDNIQMKTHLEEKHEMIQTLKEELETLLEQKTQLNLNLQETSQQLMQVQQERSGSHTVTQHDELLQQIQQLKEELDAVSQEKNQIKSDLQENVEMMIENQEELRGALEKVKNLQNTVQELESQRALMQSKDSENTSQIKQLREELENVCCERERLLSECSMNTLRDTEMMEQMKASISSLTEERDQLRQTLQSLRDEVEQLRTEQQTMVQLRSELESVCAERDRVWSERTGDMQEMSAVTEERDQLLETLQRLTDESEQLKRDQTSSHDSQLVQVREQLQTACAERDRLLSEKSKSDLENTLLEEVQSSLASVTEEREQLLEILQVNREEKNQLRRDLEDKDETLLQLREELQSSSAEKERLLSERTEEQQEKLAEVKTAEASITALTRERDRLLEMLQSLRDESEQLEKSEMMLQSVCAERDRLMTERDAACHQSSMTSLSEGDLQEILQGVRELIQVQGELKQKKPTEKQKAQLEQIQALTEEMESLRNQRVVLRKELQEAAATSKMYQDLLHVTKEELEQQQKENAELMEQSASKESQLQQQLSLMSEDLSALRDQRNTGIQNLQSNLRSLTKEKDELQDTLKRSREEGETLSLGLQKSEEMRKQLTEELECLTGLKDQLENEKICAEKILESLRDATKERDQLKRELEGKMEKLAHTESKAEQLEKQKILLESEVHSLSQSLSEVNCSVSSDQSKHPSAHLIPGIEASAEKLQAAFATLQLIIDRPTNALAAINREEWAVIYQLLQIIPKNRRTVVVTHTKKTTRLNHVLIKIAEAYRRLAQRYKTRFETQLQRDVASFEESRLQDLLALTAQSPSQSFRALQDDFQQVWGQRLTRLLERWQQYLQTLEAGVRVLEEGLSKHAVMVSEEHPHRIRDLEELRSLLGSPQASAVLQLLQRQISRRSKATEHLNTFYFALLNRCESVRSPLISASAESKQQLEDQRRQTLTLLQAQHGTLPKTEAELLQDNQRVLLQLQQTQKQMEEIQEQMKELKVQADASNLQLQELSSQLKEKEALIQSLRDKLTESEVLARRSMTPEAADLAALKDKLVKMELDHIVVTTSQEKEVAQMTSVLEHRADVIRKLKETLRKMQQDDEQSFIDGDEFDLKLCSSTKEKKMEELQKKNARFESLVSKQQEEINKWKRRAYKMKESQRDAPCTPTKRLPPLTETELNSPKKTFLDSPKSKFFDVRSSVPVPLKHPPQFFDNSSLEAVPEDACAPAESFLDSSDSDEEDSSSSAASDAAPIKDWWQIPNSSPAKPDASGNANACPTQ
ncbi:centromere-associated protein E-like isoform X2 [Sinocyclocheilus anshuiensis]|uniref:centromere-associated protein E-like isoform X2 n=1 Tax=Sinocyclocheilus anshuiensis TaxID=1608454 RepID=UPI0007B88404|nr:PREDICTED: centromere-associated protein E-like isoform X2 [Sinocyclocheilus anshuiensis]